MTRDDSNRGDANRHLPLGGAPQQIEQVELGDEVGRYRVTERIGAGGMAEVFRAALEGQWGERKDVVLKLVLPELAESPDYVGMFLDEGRLTVGLTHPNLPVTYELGLHRGRNFLAMEYVDGVSLRRLVSRARERGMRLPLDASLKLIGQLLECLSYVHGVRDAGGGPMRIVHRDVSPSNLLVTDGGVLKLLDFGIARARMHAHVTAVGFVKGKTGYMSPEQARGQAVDHRTDLYAAGTLLYLLTAGVGPFEHLSDTHAVMHACATGYFPPPREVDPSLDPELERIILQALALEADDRYASADAMLAELEAFALKAKRMPSTRAVGAVMRELFPERVKIAREPRVLRRRPAPPIVTVTDDEPAASILTEPETVGMADAPEVTGGDEADSEVTPAARPARPLGPRVQVSWLVAAGLLAALLVLLIGLIALRRPKGQPPEQAPQLDEFPRR